MGRIKDRLAHAWNALVAQESAGPYNYNGYSSFSSNRPDRVRQKFSNERTVLAAIYNRLAIDFSNIDIRHVRVDENGRYLEDVNSGLNYCLTTEANIDQAASAFKIDIALSLFDRGYIALVPVDTTSDPTVSGTYDIKTMRVGFISEWRPRSVRVNLYDDRPEAGYRKDIPLPKSMVAVVENPLYSVMNESNSTLQRLIRKLNLLDTVDEHASSDRLDLIIQLPYTVRSEVRKTEAKRRTESIQEQLRGSQYGIAYIDGTEKITQLNRPVENSLLKQVEMLINMLYVQLGLTPEVMNGTADEKTMLNYQNRTVKPIVRAVVEAMRRTFLTRTARSQGQTLLYFSNPFDLMPLSDIAEIADKFSRNEILTPNEIRQFIGVKPSSDPSADKLQNSNMPQAPSGPDNQDPSNTGTGGDNQNGT